VFVDFQKAYDNIIRNKLWKIDGPVYHRDTQMWERKSNEQVQQVYEKGSIVQFVKGVILE